MIDEPLDEFSVMVGGQGGDGSLTLMNLFGDVLSELGYHLYQARNVGSRIKGGSASAWMRASRLYRGGLGDVVDLLVAFDREAVAEARPYLHPGSAIVFDASDGPLAASAVPPACVIVQVPFSRLAVRDLRRDLFKNALAFGVGARLLGFAEAAAEAALTRSLARLPDHLVRANLDALRHGFEYGTGNAARASQQRAWARGTDMATDRVLMTGNEAIALGFLVAGGRFFSGYPITPASEILEWLSARLPEFGGVAVQAEDELAAINMALGAALGGVRAMTASSGPGIALMQEGVGHLGAAEIGVVVVDCQRAGPSTGMPTKPEQSDIGMLIHGANGDIPRIVLAASDPIDAFESTILACNLADQFQGPVYIALDQAVSQNAATVPRFDLGSVVIDRGKMLDAAHLQRLSEFRRYALDGGSDGISPWVAFGTPGGRHLVTGNEHDQWGRVSVEAANRVEMVTKRARKLAAVRASLPRARRLTRAQAAVALVGFGLDAGVAAEAGERLEAAGLPVSCLQLRTLWPVLEDVLETAAACRATYVVEHNASGQYAQALRSLGAPADRVHSVLKFDGSPFRPAALAAEILALEAA